MCSAEAMENGFHKILGSYLSLDLTSTVSKTILIRQGKKHIFLFCIPAPFHFQELDTNYL